MRELELFEMLETELNEMFFADLDAELSLMFGGDVVVQTPVVQTPVEEKTTRKRGRKGGGGNLNETMAYLYSNRAKVWEEWSSTMVSYALKKGLVNRTLSNDTRVSEARDMVYSFLAWMCEENKLKGRTHERVMFHWVQSTMFVQWVQRTREKDGQDALSRMRDRKNRTQQERRVGTFNISSPEASRVIVERDENTGEEVSSDIYNPREENEIENEVYLDQVREVIGEAIRKATENDDEADMWMKVWDTMLLQKDPSQKLYETDQAWADEWNLPVASLRRLRDKVKKVVSESGVFN